MKHTIAFVLLSVAYFLALNLKYITPYLSGAGGLTGNVTEHELTLTCSVLYFAGNYCGEPPKVKDGQVRNETKNGTTTAYYSCKEGFTRIGTSQITCLSTGKWKKAKIKCGKFQSYHAHP